uniref:SUEL-type lectin domain-containing protein n=2 Tax=Phytophthora fragariae TaxID=53985 RepID=A0A6A3EMV5_9STRA|nr:hypothetical protein PF009_g18472 [Phytophthora fragariae]
MKTLHEIQRVGALLAVAFVSTVAPFEDSPQLQLDETPYYPQVYVPDFATQDVPVVTNNDSAYGPDALFGLGCLFGKKMWCKGERVCLDPIGLLECAVDIISPIKLDDIAHNMEKAVKDFANDPISTIIDLAEDTISDAIHDVMNCYTGLAKKQPTCKQMSTFQSCINVGLDVLSVAVPAAKGVSLVRLNKLKKGVTRVQKVADSTITQCALGCPGKLCSPPEGTRTYSPPAGCSCRQLEFQLDGHSGTTPAVCSESILTTDGAVKVQFNHNYLMVVAYDEDDEDENQCATVASAIAVQATGACQLLSLGKIQSMIASVNLDGSGSMSLYTDDSCKAVIQSYSVAGESVNNEVCVDSNKFYSSVTPPATFAVQGFYQDADCATSPKAFVSVPSESCSAISCAIDNDLNEYSSTQCTTNSTAFIKSAYGSNSYLMVVNYDANSDCDTVASAKGYLADGQCQVVKDGKILSASAVLNSDGSATLNLYTDVGCTQGVVTKTIPASSINTDVCTSDTKYLSSATQAKMFVTQDYYRDTACASTTTALVSVPSDSCTESSTCNTANHLTASMEMHCTTDPVAYAGLTFGNNGYLMFVGYVENTNCEVIDWVFAHLADGACQIVSLEKAASAKAYLNSDGSATLIYYNDTDCSTGEQTQQIPDLALNNDSCTSTVKYVAGYATSNGSLVYTPTDNTPIAGTSTAASIIAPVAMTISFVITLLFL